MLLLTAATKQETGSIGQPLTGCAILHDTPAYTLSRGEYKGSSALLLESGIGHTLCVNAVTAVLKSHSDISALLSFGFAGALVNYLSAGDIVLTETIYYDSDNKSEDARTDEELCHTAGKVLSQNKELKWFYGNSITVEHTINGKTDKEALVSRTGKEALICEMEDYWLSKAAEKYGIPFLSVRVIYDELNHSFPDYENFVDEHGTVKPGKASLYFITHPTDLLRAPLLYECAGYARQSLTKASYALVSYLTENL